VYICARVGIKQQRSAVFM